MFTEYFFKKLPCQVLGADEALAQAPQVAHCLLGTENTEVPQTWSPPGGNFPYGTGRGNGFFTFSCVSSYSHAHTQASTAVNKCRLGRWGVRKSLASGSQDEGTEEGLHSRDSTSAHFPTLHKDLVISGFQGIIGEFALVQDVGNTFHKSRRACLYRPMERTVCRREKGSGEMPDQ